MRQTFLGARQPFTIAKSKRISTSRKTSLALVSSLDWAHRKSPASKRPQNEAGSFWVANTCIDCDTCRWMAPNSFTRVDGQSAVTTQPESTAERVRALQALLSCPVGAIHGDNSFPEELKQAQLGLPAPIPGLDGIFHNGYHGVESFAAASYFLKHPAGNILVDSPRYNAVLAQQLEAMGGVEYIFLTHKDDVNGHEQWAKHFNAVRIMHKGEMCEATQGVEILLEGEGPWTWSHVLNHPANHHNQNRQQPAFDVEGIQLVFTPGHTTHHVCMYHPRTKTIFTGDHLAAPQDESQPLVVFKDFCWYNFDMQLDSVQKLLQYDWLHVLPAHGHRSHLKDAAEREKAVAGLLQQHGRAASYAMEF